ncbi:Uncharacterized protein HZ326_20611 [Fusarium oxysporum f. sp. albedinis]|nr:Uncharacterized protein HZ326_20611 [Fusarium oxysporum f. sp. albedinis]
MAAEIIVFCFHWLWRQSSPVEPPAAQGQSRSEAGNWRLGVFEGHPWGFWLLDPAADSHLQDCTHEVFRRLTNLKVDRLFDYSIR